jgi:hypothetical protein
MIWNVKDKTCCKHLPVSRCSSIFANFVGLKAFQAAQRNLREAFAISKQRSITFMKHLPVSR